MDMIPCFDQEAVPGAVQALIASGAKVAIACTGGGAGVGKMLWGIPGISAALVGYYFPYHLRDMEAFLGFDPAKEGWRSCSREMAVAFARTCYFRAQEALAKDGDLTSPVVGVGLTGAMTTTRTLRGGTRLYAAVYTREGIHWCFVELEQGFLGRQGDGELCDIIVLNMVLHGAKVPLIKISGATGATSQQFESCETGEVKLKPQVLTVGEDRIAFGDLSDDCSIEDMMQAGPIFIRENGQASSITRWDYSKAIIFPGSFNPLHYGHMAMVRAIEAKTGKCVIFEISGKAVDKTPQGAEELLRRAAQFYGFRPVIVRLNSALFVDKVKDYDRTDYIIGADTALRLFDPKYYGDDKQVRDAAMMTLYRSGTYFHVFGRKIEGFFRGFEDVYLRSRGEDMIDLGHFMSSIEGRWDVSSTVIRGGTKT